MKVTGAESRVRNAFHAIFQKSATLQDAQPGDSVGGELNVSEAVLSPPQISVPKKTVQLVRYFPRLILINSPHNKKFETSPHVFT